MLFNPAIYYCIIGYFNSMGYIVPFLTISSIMIDVCFTNLIGAIFNSYNYWYLLSYSNQFTLHYSILFLITSIIIIPLIYCYFRCYIKFNISYISGRIYLIFSGVIVRCKLNYFYLSAGIYWSISRYIINGCRLWVNSRCIIGINIGYKADCYYFNLSNWNYCIDKAINKYRKSTNKGTWHLI